MYSKKSNRKNYKISLWCTLSEKRYIEIRAKDADLSASEYVRSLGLKDNPDKPVTLPPEVQASIGKILQLEARIQTIARKRLDGDDLDAVDRAQLKYLCTQLELLILELKYYLQ